jgi:hypothetical protein
LTSAAATWKRSVSREKRYANCRRRDIAQMEGRLQRYATNFDCHDGELRPNPTEDPDRIDERRAALGMAPFWFDAQFAVRGPPA